MPIEKLSKAGKRAIYIQAQGNRSKARMAESFGISVRQVQRVLKEARAEHYYTKCWYCGAELANDDIFCNEICDAAWNTAQDKFLAGDKTALDKLYTETPESKLLGDR